MTFIKYEELEVYRTAYRTALLLHKLSLDFPKFEQFGGLADQIRRASKSICANLAEGESKLSSTIEEQRFLRMALGSCEETRVWLQFAGDLGYLSAEMAKTHRATYAQIARMLHGLMRRRSLTSQHPDTPTS
jgi:four helix bundle protein